MFENLKNVSEPTKHSGQKNTWSCKQGERSEERIDEEDSETGVATEPSEKLATEDKASECSPVNMQLSETKHDLTMRELDILKERIMPLMPEKEIEWVIITRDITNTLTIRDKKAMLQIICKKLEQHADAFAQVRILLVHAAQWPDQYPNPLEEFYAWLLRKYKGTARQQVIKFNSLLKNMHWSWETNPADRILAIMHEVYLTWDDAVSNNVVRDEFKAIIASKIKPSLYVMLCEKPVNEWYNEITNIWRKLRIKEPVEADNNTKPLNTTGFTYRPINENRNEGVRVLNVEANDEKLNKKLGKQPEERCPRCRKGIHPIRNCPLPRKKGKGSRKKDKIKRQKF